MRRHLLVVSEKKIKMLKTKFGRRIELSIIGGATIFFVNNLHTITNICIKQGLIIFNIVGVMLRTDDARRLDTGCRTLSTIL